MPLRQAIRRLIDPPASPGLRLGFHAPASHPEMMENRAWLAARFLRGAGIEIGALHMPQAVPPGVHVTYVDKLSVADMQATYPELGETRFTSPDVIDDGETLATFADSSQDFVIANHFLEHCENPIGALRNIVRVLKPGAHALLAIPLREFTFDKTRELTTLEHLLRDDREGPEWSRHSAYLEWMEHIHGVTDPAEKEREASKLEERRYSIHFHVFDEARFLALLAMLRVDMELPFVPELTLRNGEEFVAVLRKV